MPPPPLRAEEGGVTTPRLASLWRRTVADLKRIMSFHAQGRCFRAEHNGRRFLLLSDSRSGSWALYEQTPLAAPASDAGDPGALEARPVARSRRRRRLADDQERRMHGTLRGLGLIGFDDDLAPVEQREGIP